ncbi:MAG TPA: hypothetical protein VKU82_00765 [Planctomycetaceae bacterium]|nr:hypothetical protein [Planctomycetaceae bacterium]
MAGMIVSPFFKALPSPATSHHGVMAGLSNSSEGMRSRYQPQMSSQFNDFERLLAPAKARDEELRARRGGDKMTMDLAIRSQ